MIQEACVWGTICNASAGMGKMVPDAYGVSPWAIFVRPDSRIRRPEDLRDVPVSVGMRAGSHFVCLAGSAVPAAREHQGGEHRRLRGAAQGAHRRRGRGAASLLPPQIAMAEQLGLRRIIEDTFKTLWWVPDGFEPQAVRGYLRALERAEQAMDADMAKYLPLWKLAIPAEFENLPRLGLHEVRPRRALLLQSPATRGVRRHAPAGRALGLDQFLKDRSYEKLSYAAP